MSVNWIILHFKVLRDGLDTTRYTTKYSLASWIDGEEYDGPNQILWFSGAASISHPGSDRNITGLAPACVIVQSFCSNLGCLSFKVCIHHVSCLAFFNI